MIPTLSWVPKGASKLIPSVTDPLSKEEIDEMKKKLTLFDNSVESEKDNEDMSVDAEQQYEIEKALGAANALGKKAGGTSFPDIADGLDELNMDAYDDEDDAIDILCAGIGDTFYPSNELDPYLKDTNDDDDSEEAEDMVTKPEDAVVVCARIVDKKAQILVNIIEDPDGDINQYVRNDIDIPAFPLCTAWLDCPIKGGEKGNFMAVGTMDPGIGIWDLDIINQDEPAALTLGGIAEKQIIKKGKRIKESIKYKEDSHTDSVLALAWNKVYRNILASGSADKTMKIWDVATGNCKITMEHHTDKAII